ncbi:glycosyltransferase family 2 protein [Fictibacillus fluitans]|uniref:Glycosyltransferase n=1 Tax=Fictibacillus fluitans TaxID=3058422 RepID=A0ABT8I129_9BACL|nr:glycosyltransferase [Fictibacillus sp. NE201]MDN4526722.1 glycosyltransferase [Fictibacillus sp. NE201]
MTPVISIIIPIFNVEQYLVKCLESIRQQSYENIEVLLVNDGSTDQSLSICERFAFQDKRFKVINRVFKGVSAARNAGVAAAQGQFIGFVDGDDYIDKDMYQTLYHLCIENECDISICKLGREVNGKVINFDTHGFTKVMSNEEAMRELFKGILYRFSLCNKLFNKKCFQDVSFPEGRIHEDLSTTYRLLAQANKISYTNFTGYIYVKRENSILTSHYTKKRLQAFIAWEEILLFMSNRYSKVFNEVIACFTFACMDHVNYICSQINNKQEKEGYIKKLQTFLRKRYMDILFNPILPAKYKALVSLLAFHVNLFLLGNSAKKLLNKRVLLKNRVVHK